MRLFAACCRGLAVVALPVLANAQAAPNDAQYIKTAEGGAPAFISSQATIARIDAKGTLTKVRAGTNGFTCFVGVPDDPDAPFCADPNAMMWLTSALSGQPKPANSTPGIAYMAKGGHHMENAAGDMVMGAGPGTHLVAEPPHWMMMWAFDPATTGLPVKENGTGVYVMFAGTPYAHLMIYQDPNKLK